ncbi:hypothetical protein BJV77DRAFT_1154409 [Russula vinacea]|nr:hypothetical protein BJV77DRAFT_1154409 [Russula vinacea]
MQKEWMFCPCWAAAFPAGNAMESRLYDCRVSTPKFEEEPIPFLLLNQQLSRSFRNLGERNAGPEVCNWPARMGITGHAAAVQWWLEVAEKWAEAELQTQTQIQTETRSQMQRRREGKEREMTSWSITGIQEQTPTKSVLR